MSADRLRPRGWLSNGRVAPVLDAALLLLAVLLVWQVVARDELFTPPAGTLAVLADGLVGGGWILPHLAATLYATVVSFAVGTVLGLLLGVVLGVNRWGRTVLGPTLFWLYSVPKIVLYPLLLLFVGVNQQSLITLATIAAFFPLAINTAAGIQTVRRTHLKVARSFGATAWQMARHVYLPTIRIPVLIGLRLAWSLAFLTVVMAEMVVANFGLGKLMFDSYANLNIARMTAVMVLVFVLALVPNTLPVLWERQRTRRSSDRAEARPLLLAVPEVQAT